MTLVIISKREGFRRCGVAHSVKETTWPADHFSEEQVKDLEAEPMLIVSYREGEDGTSEADKAAADKAAADKAAADKAAADKAAADKAAADKAAAKVEAGPMPTKPEGYEDLIAAIVVAIEKLDKDKDFTASGTPRVKSIEEMLGYDITAAEVADAFEDYKKGNN